jgi:hypothetical protein
MKTVCLLSFLWIAAICTAIPAQTAFEVIDLEGTAKMQRVQKQKWEKISVGTRLSDNDIIETYFQTKITIKISGGTTVLFGSNSKALLNISSREIAGRKTTKASFSLFNGGMLAKANGKATVNIFTTNAIGEIDSGTLSVIVDTKSGETGFLGLGGKSSVRNISQQKGIDLDAGYTTIVIPGREPAPPLQLSFRHATILRQFFGDKLITEELQASSITPAPDQSAGSARSAVSAAGSGSDKYKIRTDLMTYPRVFNLKRIYGSIVDDRQKNERLYNPVPRPALSAEARGSAEIQGSFGLGTNPNSLFAFVPRFRFPYVEAGLRFAVGFDYQSAFLNGFNSLPALFDKIERLTIGSVDDSLYLTAGTLCDLTLGSGLVVSRFRNTGNNRFYHPFGLAGKADLFNQVRISAFLANVAAPSPIGIHAIYDLSTYTFGAGFYQDFDQYLHVNDTADLRYTRILADNPVKRDTSTLSGQVKIYELNFGAMVAEYYNFGLHCTIDFAQKRSNGLNDGYIIKPLTVVEWPFYAFGIGVLIETGRLVSGEFDEFYSSRPSWVVHVPNNDTLLTPNTLLSKRRQANSLFFDFKGNPGKNLDVCLRYTQGILLKNAFARTNDSVPDTLTTRYPPDYSFDFRCAVNDKVIPFVKYAGVYLKQSHAGLYPRSGGFMASWNSEAGFDVTSQPLFMNFSVLLGGRLFFLDHGPHPDNRIGAADRIFELITGIRWDFQ